MSSQITTAFVQQYSANIQMLSQQMGSLLRDKVRVESVTGKNALREPFVNLQLAILIKDILGCGGAHVYITRNGEGIVSLQERISKVNRTGSQIALRINHSSQEEGKTINILHYPNSKKGSTIAALLKESLKTVYGSYKITVDESANPFLQQTHSPAVELFLVPIDQPFFEKLLLNPDFLRKEAEAISRAIIEYMAQGKARLSSATITVKRYGKPVEGASVTINGIHTGTTSKDGKVFFSMLDPIESLIQIKTKDGIIKIYRFKPDPEVKNEISIDIANEM